MKFICVRALRQWLTLNDGIKQPVQKTKHTTKKTGSKTKTLAKQIMFNSVSMYRICDAHEHTDAVRNSIRLCDFHCGGARLWPSCVSRVKARHLVTHDGLAQHKEKQNSIEFELSLSWARSRWPGNFVMSPWHRVRGSAPQTFEVNKTKKKFVFLVVVSFRSFYSSFPSSFLSLFVCTCRFFGAP